MEAIAEIDQILATIFQCQGSQAGPTPFKGLPQVVT